MLTGKQFQLRTPTIALDVVNGQSVAVTTPFEAVIRVTSEPSTSDDGMLNVLWKTDRSACLPSMSTGAAERLLTHRAHRLRARGAVITVTTPPATTRRLKMRTPM